MNGRSRMEWTGICIQEKKADARPEEQRGSYGVHLKGLVVGEEVVVGEDVAVVDDVAVCEWKNKVILAF